MNIKPKNTFVVGKKTIELEYPIGMNVYLVTDTDQFERIVTAVTIRETGVIYSVALGVEESWHCGFELQVDEDTLLKVK